MSNINLSWQEIEAMVQKLAAEIKAAGFVPDRLIGITVGGLIPLALLAQEMDIRNVSTVSASSYKGKEQGPLRITNLPEVDLSGQKVLLVDEIADSGETLRQVSEALRNKCQANDLKTATLVLNEATCKFQPDFSAFSFPGDSWVAFPWEKPVDQARQ